MEISDDMKIEGFTIEDNVLKGVHEEFPENCNIGKIILDTLNSKPYHISQIDADTKQQTNFLDMKDRSVRCGLWLRKQGVGPGDVVTICTHNHLDVYAPIFATFYVGATYNAWSHEIVLNPARHLMKLIQPKVVFACESVVNVILEAAYWEKVGTKIIVFGRHCNAETLDDVLANLDCNEVLNFSPVEIKNPDNIAVILLSSGSTGLPKGVMHSYRNLTNIIQSFGVYAMKGVGLWYSTCYWITGIANTLINCLAYGTRIIHSEFDVEETCQVVEKYKVQRILLVASAITFMCKSNASERYKLQCLEYMFTGGSKVNTKILEQFKTKWPHVVVSVALAMSETGRYTAMQNLKCKSIDSCGFVSSRTRIKIVDTKTGETLGANQRGEIYYKPLTLMIGYYKNPEATKEAIDEEGWLHSGDEGYYDENGEIFVTDRLKEVMKYRNHHVSPSEIEEVLLRHPGVMEVAVVGLPHEIDGHRPLAFVQRHPELDVTEEELVELSRQLGDLKMLAAGVKFIDEMPKTPSGKPNKMPLKQIAKELAEVPE